MKKHSKFETQAVRTQIKRSLYHEHSVPIYSTSSFVFDTAEDARAAFAEESDAHIYARLSNPNTDDFIEKMCLLEGAEDGVATATGMAAIFLALTSHLRAGDHIVASRSLFGTTCQVLDIVLPRWGITHTYVSIDNNEEWKESILPHTRLLFAETPSNPGLDICDLAYLGKLAAKHNCLFVVDNTFATPFIQNPVKFGAHLVCHSATKFLDGQGRLMGGAVLGAKNIIKDVYTMSCQTGPTLSAFNAWLLSKSLETLALRMGKHSENALKLAQYLETSKEVLRVRYPFLSSHRQHVLAKQQMKQGGALVSFELSGGVKRCMKFLNKLKMLSITPNLGDTRTSVTHPASTTHSKLTAEERAAVNITDGLIRLSAGLEHVDDTIADIEQAIRKSE